MPHLPPTPTERRSPTPPQPESTETTILGAVFGLGRDLRHAVLGRPLTNADIEALKVEARTNEHFPRTIWWRGIRDQAVLSELACIAAEHHPVELAAYFSRLDLHDARARIEIAKRIARKAGSAVGNFIDQFAIRSEKDRVEVALVVAAHSPSAIIDSIGRFKIQDARARFDIALAVAKKEGEELSRGLKNFNITDATARFELAKVTVCHHREEVSGSLLPAPHRSSRHIQNFQLSPAQLVEVARLAADFPRGDLPQFIDCYGITDQKLLIELATTTLERSPLTTIENIQRFRITDHAPRIELARTAAVKDPLLFIRYFDSFGIEEPSVRAELALVCAKYSPTRVAHAMTTFAIEDPDVRTELARQAMNSDPVQCLPLVIERFDLSSETLTGEIIDSGFARLGGTYDSRRNRASAAYQFGLSTSTFRQTLTSARDLGVFGIDPDEALALEPHERMRAMVKYLHTHVPRLDGSLSSFLDEVQAEELLPGALAATLLTWNSCELERYPNRGRAALARVMGYDLPIGKISPNGARELWGTLFTAHELLGEAPSVRLPVTFENRPQALRFITLGSAIIGLGGTVPRYSTPLSGQALDAEIQRLETALEETFARQMGINSLKAGSLERLLVEWGGDITPFSVLAARFRQGHGWSTELPVLASIASNVLDGTFLEKRYARTDTQLACLNDRQLAAWRENTSTLMVHTASGDSAARAASVRVHVRSVFETNLLAHLPEEVATRVSSVPTTVVSRFVGLTERDRAREQMTFADAVGLLRTAINSSSDEELKLVVTAMNGLKQGLLRPIAEKEPEIARQISDDLNTLKELFRSRKGTEGQRYVVFSTITDDPKLLLMTGDLVQSASCQNFRSGSHIGTLPGYVIDGNIKLALSYVVKKPQFDTALAQLGLEPDAPCRVEFDAPRQILRISRQDDVTRQSVELELGYAMRREILRLGAHARTGKAVLLTERPYLQPHPIDRELAQQQRELIAGLRGAIGASTPGRLFTTTFPASRNPGGVYSDLCGGTKVGPYNYPGGI